MKLIDQLTRKPCFVAFGQAMASGGITSVDLVATRDANTVTMTASDGSAAPMAAADGTNAGVMTAADKAKLDGLSAATTHQFPDRANAVAALIDAGVTHVRTAAFATAGDGGGALYRRAASAPAHALQFQSADGAFWELVPEAGAVNVRQAGAVGDGVTDDHRAFLDAIEAFPSNVSSIQQGAVRVVVPEGDYFIGSTINLHSSVIIEGQGVGNSTGGASVLIWPVDTTGFMIQRFNTTGTTTEVPDDANTRGGDGSIIRNLSLRGSGNFGVDADGVWMRANGTVEQCVINGFSRDGIHIEAGAGTGGTTEGNANIWRVSNCRLINNKRNGLYTDGADVNSGTAISVDASSNGRWGIFDSSFLGNSYIGCHSATNGVAVVAGNTGSSFVHYNGPENGNTDHRYSANIAATEADLVATVPGTDANVWIEANNLGPHFQVPTWTAAQPAGTFFHGGAFQTDNPNARNIFIGCYTEADQGPAQIVRPTQVMNGLQAAGVMGTGLHIDGNTVTLGNLGFSGRDDDSVTGMALDLRRSKDSLIYANIDGDHPAGTQFLGWDNIDQSWAFGRHSALDARIPLKFTTNLTNKAFGRSATLDGGYPYFPRGTFLGNGIVGRFLNFDVAPPTTGAYAKGDIVLNYSPTAAGTLGWVCVTSGSPGTWLELAIVSKAEWDTAKADILDLQTRVTALEAAP
jgi:hypothetical protein